ncbi:MAG: hypothetical protein ACI4RI_03535 [Ruminococcus sp.]
MQLKDLEQYRTIEELQKALGLSSKAKAIQWVRMHVPKEPYFQKKIIKYLRKTYPTAVVWKQNNGEYSSMNGIPDVGMVKQGQYYGFEVKRPFIGELTSIQKKTMKELQKAGAIVNEVIYVSDVKAVMKHQNAKEIKK